MCCKKQNNIDLSSCLQHLLLLPDISDPYLIQRAQPLHGYHDDPCSWGGESWSFCSDVVSRDRQQCGKEEEGGGGKGGEEGHRVTHQKQQRARLRGPAFPAASFPCSWPAEQSGHLSFPCRFWSIVLLPLSFSRSSPPSATACSCCAWCHFLIGFCLCLLVGFCLSA